MKQKKKMKKWTNQTKKHYIWIEWNESNQNKKSNDLNENDEPNKKIIELDRNEDELKGNANESNQNADEFKWNTAASKSNQNNKISAIFMNSNEDDSYEKWILNKVKYGILKAL